MANGSPSRQVEAPGLECTLRAHALTGRTWTVVLVEWRTVSFRTGRQPLLLADLEATNDLALSRLFMVAVWERN